MSLSWVKLHIPLLDNEDYKRFSPPAQHLYMTLLMLAGKQDKGDFSGRLETATGPITLKEVRSHAKWSPSILKSSLEQLLKANFILREKDGTLVVNRFREKSEPKSTERVKRLRAKRDGNADGTVSKRNAAFQHETDTEAESRDYDSLRSSAIRFGEWPGGPDPLADLARIFIDRFANCRDPEKVKRLLRPYTTFLASMRRRGVTIAQAWSACEDCWRAGGEVPLFGGTIRSAADFLPAFKPREREKGEIASTVVGRQPEFVPSTLSAEEREQSAAAGAQTLENLRGKFGNRSEAVV